MIISDCEIITVSICPYKSNKDENVHRFAIRKREREGKRERKREREREREKMSERNKERRK